jgi:hypothetical protein
MILFSRRSVVIGPYISSAEARNKAIGYAQIHLLVPEIMRKMKYLPGEACVTGRAFYVLFPIECCYATGFLRFLQIRNAAGCSRSIRCVVPMIESYHKVITINKS